MHEISPRITPGINKVYLILLSQRSQNNMARMGLKSYLAGKRDVVQVILNRGRSPGNRDSRFRNISGPQLCNGRQSCGKSGQHFGVKEVCSLKSPYQLLLVAED